MINLPERVKKHEFLQGGAITTVGKNIEAGISMLATDMNRATHYNTLEELEVARKKVHTMLFLLDRSVYGALACLPGTTDYSKIIVIKNLLSIGWNPPAEFKWVDPILTMDHERMMLDFLISTLPPNRMLNLFASFEEDKINNARMRNSVLPFLLNSKNLEWWSLKYRKKMKKALTHCWGKKMTTVISSILAKIGLTSKEQGIIKSNVFKYVHGTSSMKANVCECICFIFQTMDDDKYTLPLFVKFFKAHLNFEEAKGLPKEVIEGIRASSHPDIDKAKTLEVAQSSMTTKEKRLVQNQAQKAGVEIAWDPFKAPLVELIIYGFKMGFTTKIYKAIGIRAKQAAKGLPMRYDNVAIICDDSFSMSGSTEQKLKALATAYATTEMLRYIAPNRKVFTTSGLEYKFRKPAGETNLARPLIEALKIKPDAIFVVSDGYENAPEGRFGEVLKIARDKLDLDTPVYHFNPVAAAESKIAQRRLSELAPMIPVSNPEKLGLGLFKTMIAADPKQGIIELFNMVLPEVEKTKQLPARKLIEA